MFAGSVAVRETTVLEAFITLVSQLQSDLLQYTSGHGIGSVIWSVSILFPAAMALLWVLQGAIYIYTREWRLPDSPDLKLTVAVIVPAHNEELVIEQTLQRLLEQDYPHLQIHVVSDGSTDTTVPLARNFESRGVVVHDLQPNRGKSGVLDYALSVVETDLFLVVDADTQADRRAIRFLVQQFIDPEVAGVTGGIRVSNPHSLLTRMQAMEYTVIVSLAKRAEQFWGVLNTVSGAAACFRTTALRAVGGWTSLTATEDIEMSWRLQSAGWRLAYEVRAIFRVQAPETLLALYRQRMRWAQGMTQVLKHYGNPLRGCTFRLVPMIVTTLGTGVWSLLVLIGLGTLAMRSLSPQEEELDAILRTTTFFESFRLVYWTLGLFFLQSLLACAVESHYTRGILRLLPFAILYPVYYWIVIFPSFLLGTIRGFATSQATQWSRTDRVKTSQKSSQLEA